MKGYPDVKLVAIAQATADAAAFDELFRRYHDKLKHFMLSHADAHLVDDIMQETYLKAYMSIRRFEGKAAFSTWLFSIGINEARQQHRKNTIFARLKTLFLTHKSDMEHPDKTPGYGIDIHLDFERRAESLSTHQRDVYVLSAIYGYSHSEISTQLAMPLGSVKTYFAQAEALLRAK